MLRFVLSGLIWSLVFSPLSASAQGKKTIRWLGWEQVPNFISQGPFQGEGIGDSFTRLLQNKLTQYNHKLLISNARRYHRLIREEDVCVAWAWIVPGSRNFRTHSRPISLAPRTGIQTLKSKQHLFGKPEDTLSLAKLLANPAIKLGYLQEMTYSKKVHELLDQYQGQKNILYSSRNAVEFSLAMLDSNRVDYFFGFSAQAIYDAKVKGIPNKYQFYDIEEMAMYTSMHTHCSKTPFGMEIMEEVKDILTDDVLMDHLATFEKWYGNNSAYREAFMDYVIKQKPHALVSNPGQ